MNLDAGFSSIANSNSKNIKFSGEYFSDNTGELIENNDLKSALSVSSNTNYKSRVD